MFRGRFIVALQLLALVFAGSAWAQNGDNFVRFDRGVPEEIRGFFTTFLTDALEMEEMLERCGRTGAQVLRVDVVPSVGTAIRAPSNFHPVYYRGQYHLTLHLADGLGELRIFVRSYNEWRDQFAAIVVEGQAFGAPDDELNAQREALNNLSESGKGASYLQRYLGGYVHDNPWRHQNGMPHIVLQFYSYVPSIPASELYLHVDAKEIAAARRLMLATYLENLQRDPRNWSVIDIGVVPGPQTMGTVAAFPRETLTSKRARPQRLPDQLDSVGFILDERDPTKVERVIFYDVNDRVHEPRSIPGRLLEILLGYYAGNPREFFEVLSQSPLAERAVDLWLLLDSFSEGFIPVSWQRAMEFNVVNKLEALVQDEPKLIEIWMLLMSEVFGPLGETLGGVQNPFAPGSVIDDEYLMELLTLRWLSIDARLTFALRHHYDIDHAAAGAMLTGVPNQQPVAFPVLPFFFTDFDPVTKAGAYPTSFGSAERDGYMRLYRPIGETAPDMPDFGFASRLDWDATVDPNFALAAATKQSLRTPLIAVMEVPIFAVDLASQNPNNGTVKLLPSRLYASSPEADSWRPCVLSVVPLERFKFLLGHPTYVSSRRFTITSGAAAATSQDAAAKRQLLQTLGSFYSRILLQMIRPLDYSATFLQDSQVSFDSVTTLQSLQSLSVDVANIVFDEDFVFHANTFMSAAGLQHAEAIRAFINLFRYATPGTTPAILRASRFLKKLRLPLLPDPDHYVEDLLVTIEASDEAQRRLRFLLEYQRHFGQPPRLGDTPDIVLSGMADATRASESARAALVRTQDVVREISASLKTTPERLFGVRLEVGR